MEIKDLYYNKWISLKKMKDPEKDVHGYVYSHEERCNGQIISILPYRLNKDDQLYEYLLLNEITPCWDIDNYVINSITGGVENNNPNETAKIELNEEAGYDVELNEIQYLGWTYGIKSSDTIYYLYTVDLTDKEAGIANGDGSEIENKNYCFWENMIGENVRDPFVYVNFCKIIEFLKADVKHN